MALPNLHRLVHKLLVTAASSTDERIHPDQERQFSVVLHAALFGLTVTRRVSQSHESDFLREMVMKCRSNFGSSREPTPHPLEFTLRVPSRQPSRTSGCPEFLLDEICVLLQS